MRRPQTRSPRPGWPLAVIFLGLPAWWLIGVWQLIFFAMTVPMALYLMKQRLIAVPRGFGLWLLWILWLLTGLMVMQVDAPGAVPGGGTTRYLTFGYRFGWYVIASVVALYVLNVLREVNAERIARILAWFFVMLIAGGLLGLLLPSLSFPSLLQMILPNGIARQPFVHDLIHVQVAQIQTFLGTPQPRPSAPFAYTNEWGLATACTLPFFLAAWWNRGRRWRIAAVLVTVVAMFTVVSSLNRGTWGAIAVMAIFIVVRSAALGRVKLLVISMLALIGIGALLSYTSMGDLMLARFDNPHSDEGRTNLGLAAVQSAAEGSPVVGFGTTRDVAGNFSSIAGGASDACPKCTPPPLGTHGQLWLAIFGAGFVGAFLYVGFLLSQFVRGLRAQSPYAVAGLCTLITLICTMPIYPSVGVGLYVGFIAIGIVAHEVPGRSPSLHAVTSPVSRHIPVVALSAAIGTGLGLAAHAALGTSAEATQRILVPASELVAVPGSRPLTLDAEALLSTSEPVIRAVSDGLGVAPNSVRAALTIGAEPNTRIMLITYEGDSPEDALLGAETAATAYLQERQRLLSAAATSIEERYSQRRADLDEIYRHTNSLAASSPRSPLWETVTQVRRDSSQAGEILLNVGDAAVGHSISSPTLGPTGDVLTVRLASGLAIGGLLGIPLARSVDRHQRLGRRPAARLSVGVPVVARVAAVDFHGALRAVRSYLPIAGVIADSHSPAARHMTSLLDAELERDSQSGSRALLVADSRSKTSRVRRLYDDCVNAGVHPVGLIVCEPKRRHRK